MDLWILPMDLWILPMKLRKVHIGSFMRIPKRGTAHPTSTPSNEETYPTKPGKPENRIDSSLCQLC